MIDDEKRKFMNEWDKLPVWILFILEIKTNEQPIEKANTKSASWKQKTKTNKWYDENITITIKIKWSEMKVFDDVETNFWTENNFSKALKWKGKNDKNYKKNSK